MNDRTGNEFHTVRGYQLINRRENKLTSAMEDYLEMIYRLCIQDGYTRVGKLSMKLNVRPSSVSKMAHRLISLGLLSYDNCDSIRLTDKGKTIGNYLIERHKTIEEFLSLLGNSAPLEETELIEHSVTPETVIRIKTLLEFFQSDESLKKSFISFQKSKTNQKK